MKVIEHHLEGRRGELDGGEDRIVISADYFAVIDGATSKTRDRRANLLNGAEVADLIAGELMSLPRPATMEEALFALHQSVRGERSRRGSRGQLPNDELPSAAVIVLSVARREVWRVGDCQLAFNSLAYSHRSRSERIAAEARAALLNGYRALGWETNKLRADDPGRDMILPLLRVSAQLRNLQSPYSISAIDGYTDPTARAERFEIPAWADSVTLSSDGYLSASGSLEEAERDLAARVAHDPLMIDYPPMTKGVLPGSVSYDDRAYLRIDVTQ